MLRDNIQGLTKPAIRRVARQAGVVRINAQTYDEMRGVAKVKLEQVIAASIAYTQNGGRKTVSVSDVVNGIEAACGDHVAFDPTATAAPVVRCDA
jgi:histone H3/H4